MYRAVRVAVVGVGIANHRGLTPVTPTDNARLTNAGAISQTVGKAVAGPNAASESGRTLTRDAAHVIGAAVVRLVLADMSSRPAVEWVIRRSRSPPFDDTPAPVVPPAVLPAPPVVMALNVPPVLLVPPVEVVPPAVDVPLAALVPPMPAPPPVELPPAGPAVVPSSVELPQPIRSARKAKCPRMISTILTNLELAQRNRSQPLSITPLLPPPCPVFAAAGILGRPDSEQLQAIAPASESRCNRLYGDMLGSAHHDPIVRHRSRREYIHGLRWTGRRWRYSFPNCGVDSATASEHHAVRRGATSRRTPS